jgi:peptide/nickel transport system permease protein
LRRLAFLPVILVVVSIITFVLLRVLPGDPAVVMCGMNGTEECRDQIHEELGLNDPIPQQFFEWASGILQGDFGETYFGGRDIREEVVRRFPASAELIILSLVISVFLGVAFGIISAVRRNSPVDYSVRVFAVFGQSIPEFFLLILLIIIPSILWNYAAPSGGYVSFFDDPWRNVQVYVPPALILGIGGAAGIMRLQRTTMLEVLRSDFVRTARAKGLAPNTVIVGHAFRNTLAPLVTVIGAAFTAIFGGSVIAEQVMSIDGLGVFFLQAVTQRDFPVVQFLVLYTATVVVIVNLIVDLSYAWIDPRVQYR